MYLFINYSPGRPKYFISNNISGGSNGGSGRAAAPSLSLLLEGTMHK